RSRCNESQAPGHRFPSTIAARQSSSSTRAWAMDYLNDPTNKTPSRSSLEGRGNSMATNRQHEPGASARGAGVDGKDSLALLRSRGEDAHPDAERLSRHHGRIRLHTECRRAGLYPFDGKRLSTPGVKQNRL